jgi:membrane dipeptidase
MIGGEVEAMRENAAGPEEVVKIFDGHNDVLLALYQPEYDPAWGGPRNFFERSDHGHLDLPRATEAGFAGGFFAVWVTPDPAARRPDLKGEASAGELPPAIEHSYALRLAMAETATLFRLEFASEGRLKVVRSVKELETCLQAGVIAAILHFEGAEMIDPQLNTLEVLYEAGLRSLGPAWSRPNAFATGVPFTFPGTPDNGPGLTREGRNLIKRCAELGILIDLSHLNEAGFWDVAEISTAPLVASHSNVHTLSASPRNLLDKQLDAIRDSGGLVGVNFSVAFTREDGEKNPDTPLEWLVRHVDYLCERMGVDHVAFGSDFDGTMIPNEMGDVTGLQRLVTLLRQRGFSDANLRKLGTENWIRVLDATWKDK